MTIAESASECKGANNCDMVQTSILVKTEVKADTIHVATDVWGVFEGHINTWYPARTVLSHQKCDDTGNHFVNVIWECLGFNFMTLEPQLEIYMIQRDLSPGWTVLYI